MLVYVGWLTKSETAGGVCKKKKTNNTFLLNNGHPNVHKHNISEYVNKWNFNVKAEFISA